MPADLEEILRDPAAAFSDPAEILCQGRLSRDDKVRVLKQWRYDLEQLQAATDENLSGDEDQAGKIVKIDECLRQLAGD